MRIVLCRIGFHEVHPYLAVPTCFYLAAKVEEMKISVSTTLTMFEMVSKSHKIEPPRWSSEDVFCCENFILQAMDYSLLLQHPYRSLRHIITVLHFEEYMQSCVYVISRFLSQCSNIVNDCYFTALPLVFPPHLIAMTSVYMMCVFNGYDPRDVFERFGVDFQSISTICSLIRNFYDSGATLWPSSISDDILTISSSYQT